MADEVLSQLGLAPEDSLRLPARLRDRLVRFLLEWRHHSALDACLSELIAARPLLALLDARTRMLLEMGELSKAWDALCQRQERSTSITTRMLGARIRLAQGDSESALAVANTLLQENQDSFMAWCFLGEVRLAMGEPAAAMAAYRRANDLIPDSRSYLLGTLGVLHAQREWVAASAFAVRMQESATVESPLPVAHLRRLREYFEASHEVNRVADIDAELAARHAAELSTLQKAVAEELGHELPATMRPPGSARSATPAKAYAALDSFDRVEVQPEERGALTDAAHRLFGFPSLLPGQAEIMSCTMQGEDVLAVLPTGGGKSLCYQLPALASDSGTTLVISPLIALMKDQVDKLPAGVRNLATTINSSVQGEELGRRLEQVRSGRHRLVYAAPERLRQPPFLHGLKRSGLERLVIDEVHCVSMWGHDFRPDYLYIAEAREMLGSPPLLAMTATAAPRVREDILQRLGRMRVVAGDVMRSNLRLEVLQARNADEKLHYLIAFCRSEDGAGIVYATSRQRCEELAGLLRNQGVSAVHYHAGIDNRAEVQDEFMSGRARVVVATVAFGMGIDKADIRFIVHYEPPSSLEAYYQEAGRAGRDGLPARCVLMYTPSDRATLTRRWHRDELSEDFLRRLFAAVKRCLGEVHLGRVATDDLRRDLQAEETHVRVGISALEQVQLLRRWHDVPRSITLRLRQAPPPGQDGFAAFCRSGRLPVGGRVTRDPLQLASTAGIDVRRFEQEILAWTDTGYLECRPSARDMLLEVLPTPSDAGENLAMLLEQYGKIQGQRAAEIVAYATTRRCRHGHISAYLGGRTIERCASCDNCVTESRAMSDAGLPYETAQLRMIVEACSSGWGKHNLALILRGSSDAPPSARDGPGFGALAFRSEGALEQMIERLVEAGFLETLRLEHGGTMVKSTPAGRRALDDSSLLASLVGCKASGARSGHGRVDRLGEPSSVADGTGDKELLERLRAWRQAKARELGLPAFMVAHASLLQGIAAACPQTEEALLAVRGMGPLKMERYGAELLALVRGEVEKARGA